MSLERKGINYLLVSCTVQYIIILLLKIRDLKKWVNHLLEAKCFCASFDGENALDLITFEGEI